MPQLRIEGKGDKVRYTEAATEALRLIDAYLKAGGHDKNLDGPLFWPVKNNRTRTLAKPLNPASVYRDIVKHHVRSDSSTILAHAGFPSTHQVPVLYGG